MNLWLRRKKQNTMSGMFFNKYKRSSREIGHREHLRLLIRMFKLKNRTATTSKVQWLVHLDA